MAKEICISTTPHETRLAILEDDQLAEIYYERENEYTLAGSIYKGRVTRVLPGMQSSFVDVGLERDAFLYVTDFLEEQEDSEDYETASSGQPRRPADDAPAAVAAPAAPAAEERRGRREGRGRGENRRPERSGSEPVEAAAAPAPTREERTPAIAAFKRAEPTEADREEKGDADAPEGTRRWRGRRGRRRGGMRAGVLGASASAEAGEALAATQTASAPFSMPEHGAPGGLAAPLRDLDPEQQPASENEPQAEKLSADNTRDSGEGLVLQAAAAPVPERPARFAQPPRGAREPMAGILPGESLSKYGRAPEPPAIAAQPARPANYTSFRPATEVGALEGWDGGSVLPGESLSRYKAAAPAAPQVSSTSVAAAPSALVSLLAASDSSEAVFSNPAAATAPETHAAADELPAGGLDQISAESVPADLDAESTGGEPGKPAMPELSASIEEMPLPEAPGAELPGEESEARLDALVDAALASPAAASPETVAEALPGAGSAEQEMTSAQPIAAEEQTARAIEETEYEPQDGEASVRMSPPRTSELRLSQLFGGTDTPARIAEEADAVEPAEPSAEAAHAERAELAGLAAADETARTTLNAGSEAPYRHEADFLETGHELTQDADVTAVDPLEAQPEAQHTTDEQVDQRLKELERFRESEAASFADDPEELLAPAQAGEAAAQSDGFTELVDQLQGFSPGAGLLEEEVIDEDEYDFDPIHAHADELDLEDLEEETLDGDGFSEAGVEVELDSVTLRMEDALVERQEPAFAYESRMEDDTKQDEEDDEEEEPAAFALEEVDEEGESAPDAVAGEPQRRERTGEERGRRGGRNGRRRSAGGNGGGGGRRQSMQTQDLPIISDLLKQGQEILVQIAKEPIAKKGARITSHIALPGRFLVFMPTVSHVGVSRKIDSDEERLRLKRILISEKGDSSGGFIVRTAAEGASEEELRADLRFLISLWTEIKQRAETAKAPSLIYHDLNLVERILRDQVSSNFSTIWVDTEQEYERIVRFLNRFQPALVRRVKLYTKETPLFEHFGIQEEISKALKSKVWLKSGGSIVINQTEALVAIDINTGKYVGKTARLEDTIVKTNLDAIPEIVRQIRLRDLGGIIVIDFIDMDERKNRHRVLAALEEAMKVDRAPSKVLQFNDFGLVAITRKRVKQSLERTLSVTCDTCAGTGMVKSPITVCNEIYIELRKMMKHLDGKDVMLRVNPEVVKQLKGGNGRWITEYEEMIGKTIIIKSDPSLHPEQFDIH